MSHLIVQRRYLRWLTLTLFLTFDLIVLGAYVRLTNSGLGCPDWPGCYAHATPWHAQAEIQTQELLIPDGNVTHFKAWIEMIHRYIAAILGLLCIGLLVVALPWSKRHTQSQQQWRYWRYWQDCQVALPYSWKLPALTLLCVCVQGAFGRWTVTLKLMPIVVTGHLLLAVILLSLLAYQQVLLKQFLFKNNKNIKNIKNIKNTVIPLNSKLKYWVRSLLVVLILQILLGGWVSSNYAALACNTVPLCQGDWLPNMDFIRAFNPSYAAGAGLTSASMTAIHWVHRTNALFVLSLVVGVIIVLKPWAAFRGHRHALMAVLTMQFLTGISTVLFNYPLITAVLHSAGAAALVLITVRLLVNVQGIGFENYEGS